MLKKILSYGFVEGIAKGLNKLILLLLPFFLNIEDFGKIGLIISLELLLPFITLLGFERVILRFYQSVDEFISFKKTIFSSIFVTHLLIVGTLTFFYLFGKKDLFGLNIFPDIFLLIALVYLQGRNQIILNIYRVSENHKKYFTSRLILQIGKFLLVLGLVYFTKSYLAYVIGGLIIAVIINLYHNIKISEERYNYKTFKYFFLFSWPFIFHGIAGNLLGNADRFILEGFLSLTDVGLYTFAASIGSMMIFAYVGVSVYMEPLLYKTKDIQEFNRTIKSFLVYALFFGLLALLGIIILSEFVLVHFYEDYSSVFKYIPIIGLSYILYPFYLSSNYRMIYTKSTSTIAILSVITSVLNIGLNFVLIPKYGIVAAIAVTLFSYMIQAALFTIISNKRILTTEFIQIVTIGTTILLLVYLQLNYFVILITVFGLVLSFYWNHFVSLKSIVKR